MRKNFLFLCLLSAMYCMATEGALNGLFSINNKGDKVVFSQGNLQYQASTNTWRFAENQYDMVGSDNINAGSTYGGWIDLFGWGTSGYNNTANDPYAVNYQPWATSYALVSSDYNYYGYGPSINQIEPNLTGTSANYDWGVYNAISNGGNTAGEWRTLTSEEWYYIFYTRSQAKNLRSLATVCGVHGYVLLPDDFTMPGGLSWNIKPYEWEDNTYDSLAWSDMEAAGAVFLPAAGYHNGAGVRSVGSGGMYWSASYVDETYAGVMTFDLEGACVYVESGVNRYSGSSVRLVQNYSVPTAPTDINHITNQAPMTTKVIKDGHLLILRGDKTYTLQGQEVNPK